MGRTRMFLFITAIILEISCNCSYKGVTNDMRHEFLNAMVHSDTPFKMNEFKYFADRDTANFTLNPEDSVNFIQYIAKIDSIFTLDDARFMWKQAAGDNTFTLNQSKFADRTIIYPKKYKDLKPDLFWDKIESEYHADTYLAFGMPLFSQDLSTVLIEKWVYGDFRKYHGKVYAVHVYKRKNGTWEYYRQVEFRD